MEVKSPSSIRLEQFSSQRYSCSRYDIVTHSLRSALKLIGNKLRQTASTSNFADNGQISLAA